MLMRICDVHDIPLAADPATAGLLTGEFEQKTVFA